MATGVTATAAAEAVRRCRELAACTEEPGVTTRTFLSAPMHDVHARVRQWMQAAGMTVTVDAAGNIRGVYPGAAPTARRLFLTNETGADISVEALATQTVVATIPVGKRPRGIRVSPDGATLFVALSGSPIAPPGVDEDTLPPADKKADGIGVVSVADLKLLRVLPAGSDPEQTALTADGRLLFVANEDTGQVTAVSVDDGTVMATVAVGGEPEGVERRPGGRVV